MVVDTVGDIFRQFVLDPTNVGHAYKNDIETLVDYANTALLAISKQYNNSVVPRISAKSDYLMSNRANLS